MALYFDNSIYGGKEINLADITTKNVEYFVGANSSSSANVFSTASAAAGIDIHKTGILRRQYIVKIQLVNTADIAGSGTSMNLNFYCGDSDSTMAKKFSAVITKDELNDTRQNPIEIGLPTTFGDHSCVGITLNDTMTGKIAITLEKPSWG